MVQTNSPRLKKLTIAAYGMLLSILYFSNWPKLLLFSILHVSPREYVLKVSKRQIVRIPPFGYQYRAFAHLSLLLRNGWNVVESGMSDLLLLRKGNLQFYCRTEIGSDVTELKEIFIDRVYEYNPKSQVVIDVGMSSGNSSVYFSKKGASLVVGVEPNILSYRLALKNFKLNGVNNIIAYNALLGTSNGEKNVIIDEESGYVTNQSNESPSSNSHLVDVITINDILLQNGISYIDVLKMDCEGCEYDFIDSASNELFNRIGIIFLEYHNGVEKILSRKAMDAFEIKSHSITFSGKVGILILARKKKLE